MANKERKVKKVQARHILVGSKELADEIKKKIDDGEEFTVNMELEGSWTGSIINPSFPQNEFTFHFY